MAVINGTEFDDTLIGTEDDDVINGLGGNDTIDAGGGNDTITGGAGNDAINAGDGDDVIAYNVAGPGPGDGAGPIDGGDGDDTVQVFVSPGAFNSIQLLLTMGSSGLSIFGWFAGPGNLTTLANVESMTIDFTASPSFFLSYANSSFAVTVDLSIGAATGLSSVIGATNVIAGRMGDTIIGDAQANSLRGEGGDDTLYGGDGNDQLRGDFFASNVGPGIAGNDSLFGGDGDDIMWGGDGVDAYDGGAGSDRVSFYDLKATQGAAASLLTQTITNDGFGNAETMVSVESLGSGTAFADWFEGDDGANFIWGGIGDIVYGQNGDDTFYLEGAPEFIDGGVGIDSILAFTGDLNGALTPDANGDGLAEVVFATHGVNVDLTANTILDDGFGNSGSIFGIENVAGSGFADIINGNFTDNVISGLGGDDTLSGGSGNDVIFGGEGNDGIFGNPGDDVLHGEDGDDHLQGLTGNDTLHGGDGNDLLRGEGTAFMGSTPTGNDNLFGGSGDDIMWGGAGVDFYDGGDGLDRVSFYDATATQAAVASLLTQTVSNDGFGNAEVLVSVEGLGVGTAYADWFEGDDNANFIWGGIGDTVLALGGDDTFNLQGGPALLDGGDGVDSVLMFTGDQPGTLSPDTDGDGFAELIIATNGVHVNLSQDSIVDDGFGFSGTIINVENVAGSGLNDTLIGDGGANSLSGLLGDDTLSGLGGADTLDGGGGADDLEGGAGADTLNGGDDNDTLAGDGSNDALDGGSGDDILDGGAGLDALLGGDGLDTLNGDGGNDTLDGGAGDDLLNGGANSDALSGGDGADTLNGDGGSDTITGGAGDDVMNGGQQADVFVFASGCGHDTISGFDANPANGQDLLDISAFDITTNDFATRVSITDLGADILVTIDGQESILLLGVDGAGQNTITQSDFILGGP